MTGWRDRYGDWVSPGSFADPESPRGGGGPGRFRPPRPDLDTPPVISPYPGMPPTASPMRGSPTRLPDLSLLRKLDLKERLDAALKAVQLCPQYVPEDQARLPDPGRCGSRAGDCR